MKKKPGAEEEDNREALKRLESLGIDADLSPDQLKQALKQLVSRKVISDFRVKKEK